MFVCSSVYYKPTEESSENLEIMHLLDEHYLDTPFYGAKRLMQELLAKGYSLSIGRLRRLMKKVNWCTIYPKKRTTLSDPCACKYPYLLQGLTIDRVNQVWAIDITYIPMKKGFMVSRLLCAYTNIGKEYLSLQVYPIMGQQFR